MSGTSTFGGVPLKYISLVTLILQNSMLALILRYSRTIDGPAYYTTTAVLMNEIIKLTICLVASARLQIKEKGRFSASELYSEVFGPDAWKLMIPAALYTVQNNLQYLAADLLDAATFQVTYQLKILTTALCSVIMLNKRLTGFKWFSLVLLTVGVALVQLSADDKKSDDEPIAHHTDSTMGLICVITACIISGLAGVYFEKVLKGTSASLWIRNVQLSFFSLFPALFVGVLWTQGDKVMNDGFFYGYNPIVWAAILCQALGGIIVALVVKYADNILKGFATSISIIVSCIFSIIFLDFHLSLHFLSGASFVLIATYLYSKPDEPAKAYEPVPTKLSNVRVDSSRLETDEETKENGRHH
ncbi:uncharacterized protein VTP21DRAFT_355 [Calcarisporiella thermophila]|uniref:uncharacterized protein n=1 Tax=Calcarisporiella thermophila TaxID=911321 RepID=UPI0037427DE0